MRKCLEPGPSAVTLPSLFSSRTIYYTGYRQVLTEAQTVFRCCPGASSQGARSCLS